MRLKNWLVPFALGILVAMTANSFAQDAGLYSSEELGRVPLPGEQSVSEQLQQERRRVPWFDESDGQVKAE